MLVFIDSNKGSGVRFVHAKLDVTISDIVTPNVPSVVRSFFDFSDGELNFDGHTRPLLSIQVTELIDGIFIGCSMNHAIVDGTSYWHFWNVWSEIHRANGKDVSISRSPIHDRWFPDGYGYKDTFFPYVNRNEFIHEFNPPPFEERFFHFSSETIAKLKARANQEITNNNIVISSFQALAAFLWKSMVQAKGLKPDQQTHCKLAANTRTRLNPSLPEEYFGNSLVVLTSTVTVGELFKNNLGWTASVVHQSVVNLTNKTVNDFADSWLKSPFVFSLDQKLDKDEGNSVQVGSSPRFNIYGNEFAGLGKPIAVRSGFANKFDGKITVYPGFEGGGSVDAEISLSSAYMRALESNKEFMAVVSSP
uniref:anthranilate N-benzoyltransferase n=2 Tax=Chenopodium quinoa TaxID=63459 RepID=A0A803MV07_CHEQI